MNDCDKVSADCLNNATNDEKENVKMFRELCNAIYETYKKKNNDYGDSAHRTFEEFGHISFIVRLSDKFNRYKSLTIEKSNKCVEDERIEDTLLDMASYCLMAAIETKEENKKYEEKHKKVIF